jgi:RES domain
VTPPVSHIDWQPCWRLIPSRFPPVGLFDRVASPKDLDIIYAIEALTNDRIRDEIGEIRLVAAEDRITGEGTTPIMAAFTHPNPDGSRFSDGSYGVYYAANRIETAIAETRFHRARFLAATNQPPIEIDMRSFKSNLTVDLHDIRNKQREFPDIYDPDPKQYASAQNLAKTLRNGGSNGIAYSSIRDSDGECVAIFKPRVLSPVRQGAHYCYVWDGKTINYVYEKSHIKH